MVDFKRDALIIGVGCWDYLFIDKYLLDYKDLLYTVEIV